MTLKDKELLITDLCSRFPYGVKVITSVGGEIRNDKEQLNFAQLSLFESGYEEVKPYLFPLSSMTEEQKKELEDMNWSFDDSVINNIIECLGYHRQFVTHFDCFALIDWLNKNHFDYRGLIPMGLANDATGLNIY